MVVSLRIVLLLVIAFSVMGVVASSGRLLDRLHVKAGCNSTLVSGDTLQSCHKGWWRSSPNLLPLGCTGVGVNLWSCPAGVKP
jgi:hypothetical protein